MFSFQAKEWGNPDGHPVLALHGWQDNSGSFDNLIPLLSSDLRIVAADLPGHGLSSHKPRGAFYHLTEYVADIQRIINHLQWQKFSIVGHSMGGGISVGYTSCFPDNVHKLLILDSITPAIYPADEFPNRLTKGVNELLSVEEKMNQPPRTLNMNDVITLVVESLNESVAKESAKILLKRGTTVMPNRSGVILNRDPRLKVTSISGLSAEFWHSLVSNIQCDVLIIIASRGLAYKLAKREIVEKTLDIYKNKAKSFKLVNVDGTHHVHLNDPQIVAPYVNEFFRDLQ